MPRVDWQPIATAKQNGDPILARQRSVLAGEPVYSCHVVYWQCGGGDHDEPKTGWTNGYALIDDLSEWTPLPA